MLKRFKVVIEEEAEGGYSVFLPAFPGCTSQGETIEEALANIREAANLYIWSLKDDKLPMPESDLDVELREIYSPRPEISHFTQGKSHFSAFASIELSV